MTKILKAICLNSIDYRDNDRLLVLLSAENGKTVARIRSVKSPKSKLKAAAAPNAYAEYTLNEKGGSYTVIGAEVIEQFFGTWTDPDKNLAAGVVTETLEKITANGVGAEYEFAAGLKALFGINYGEGTPYIHSLRFLLDMLPSVGVDTDELKLHSHTRALFAAVRNAEEGELECLEYEIREILYGLSEAGRILAWNQSGELKTMAALAARMRAR